MLSYIMNETKDYEELVFTRAVEKIRTADKFVVSQPVTPRKLIKEITDALNISKAEPIAVLFTIEWAIYLKFSGYTNVKVLTQEDDVVIQRICQELGLDYILLNTVQEKNMKFNVVLTNPPYSDGNKRVDESDEVYNHGATEIYSSILTSCLDIINPDIIAGITPENFLNGGKKPKTLRERIYSDYGVKTIKFLNQTSDWNNTVSIDTVFWVADKSHKGDTKIISRYSKSEIIETISVDTILKNTESQEINDWVKSIQTTEKLRIKMGTSLDEDGPQLKISKKVENSCVIENGTVFDTDNSYWRVAFGKSRCNTAALVPPGVSIPNKYFYIKFDSEKEATNFRNYLLSKPIRFIFKMTYTQRTMSNLALTFIPNIDLSKETIINDEIVYTLLKCPATVQSQINDLIGDEVPF